MQDLENGAVANSFETGVRECISLGYKSRLKTLFRFTKPGINFKIIIRNMTMLAIKSSYYIYLNRNESLKVGSTHQYSKPASKNATG